MGADAFGQCVCLMLMLAAFVPRPVDAALRGLSGDAASSVTVKTTLGPVTGQSTGTVVSFKGIPYAAPPVGSLRWQRPQVHPGWSAPRDATQYGPGCPQTCDMPPGTCPTRTSEDCLTLNVFCPAGATGAATMVFIPGGQYLHGGAGMPFYDPSATLVGRGGVCVVTVDYRLGALGFMVTGPGHGNYGFLDQVMALQWVRDNIDAFGGDHTQVTLFGQSAGATSVATHLISPASQGLFARAIVESDPMSLRLKSLEDAMTTADKLAEAAGCRDRSDSPCLMGLSADDVVTAAVAAGKHFFVDHPTAMFYPFTPLPGSPEIPDQPVDLLRSGNYANKVPLMIGNAKHEGRMFVYSAATSRLSYLEYRVLVTYLFGLDHVVDIVKLYPTNGVFGTNDSRPELSTLGTEYLFACSQRAVADAAVAAGLPVFTYQFNHATSFDAWGPNFQMCAGYACHGVELPFIFGWLPAGLQFTPQEQELSDAMGRYWSDFAKATAPASAAEWPPYGGTPGHGDSGHVMQLDVKALRGPVTGFMPRCDYWERSDVGFNFG